MEENNYPWEIYLIKLGQMVADYNYDIETIYKDIDYFKKCWSNGLSEYKSLDDWKKNKLLGFKGNNDETDNNIKKLDLLPKAQPIHTNTIPKETFEIWQSKVAKENGFDCYLDYVKWKSTQPSEPVIIDHVSLVNDNTIIGRCQKCHQSLTSDHNCTKTTNIEGLKQDFDSAITQTLDAWKKSKLIMDDFTKKAEENLKNRGTIDFSKESANMLSILDKSKIVGNRQIMKQSGVIKNDGFVETIDGQLFVLPIRGTSDNGFPEVLIDTTSVGGSNEARRQSIEHYIGMEVEFLVSKDLYGYNFKIKPQQ